MQDCINCSPKSNFPLHGKLNPKYNCIGSVDLLIRLNAHESLFNILTHETTDDRLKIYISNYLIAQKYKLTEIELLLMQMVAENSVLWRKKVTDDEESSESDDSEETPSNPESSMSRIPNSTFPDSLDNGFNFVPLNMNDIREMGNGMFNFQNN